MQYLYLLLSFCTSLSSSSFSLVIKLCSTGISNLMYCATLWMGGKNNEPKLSTEVCLIGNTSFTVNAAVPHYKSHTEMFFFFDIYIIRDFLAQILLHQKDFADLFAWTLYDSQHQRVITALQLHTLCSGNQNDVKERAQPERK